MFDPYSYYHRSTKASKTGQVLRKKIALKSGDSHALPMPSLDYYGKILINSSGFVNEVVKQKVDIKHVNTSKSIKATWRAMSMANPSSAALYFLFDMVNKVRENWPNLDQERSLLQETKEIVQMITNNIDLITNISYVLRQGKIKMTDQKYLQYQQAFDRLTQFNQVHRAIKWDPQPEPQRNNQLRDEIITVTAAQCQYYVDNQISYIPSVYSNQTYWITSENENYLTSSTTKGSVVQDNFSGAAEITTWNSNLEFHFTPYSLEVPSENVLEFLGGSIIPEAFDPNDLFFFITFPNSEEQFEEAIADIDMEFIFDINIIYYEIKDTFS